MRTPATSLAAAWFFSCTRAMSPRPTQTTTHCESATSERQQSAAVAEVEQLHAFFVRWFRGEVPESEAEFERFASALAPEFEMVVPSGILLARAQVLAGVRGAYGQWQDNEGATIEIRNPKAHAIGGGLIRVSYEEWQQRLGEWKARRSTALLRSIERGRVEWLHVHETWIAGDE